MRWTGIGIRLTGAAAVLSVLLAGSVVWLLLTDPVRVAGALDQRTVTPVVQALAVALADALRTLLAYL